MQKPRDHVLILARTLRVLCQIYIHEGSGFLMSLLECGWVFKGCVGVGS